MLSEYSVCSSHMRRLVGSLEGIVRGDALGEVRTDNLHQLVPMDNVFVQILLALLLVEFELELISVEDCRVEGSEGISQRRVHIWLLVPVLRSETSQLPSDRLLLL